MSREFESDVNSDSIQTQADHDDIVTWFESNINSDSIQTEFLFKGKYLQFESNVKYNINISTLILILYIIFFFPAK